MRKYGHHNAGYNGWERKKNGDILLYQSTSVYYKGSFYFSPEKKWVKQFINSKNGEKLLTITIREKDIYIPSILPEAFHELNLDNAINEAEKKGFKAILVDEGESDPPSVLIFDEKLKETIEEKNKEKKNE